MEQSQIKIMGMEKKIEKKTIIWLGNMFLNLYVHPDQTEMMHVNFAGWHCAE